MQVQGLAGRQRRCKLHTPLHRASLMTGKQRRRDARPRATAQQVERALGQLVAPEIGPVLLFRTGFASATHPQPLACASCSASSWSFSAATRADCSSARRRRSASSFSPERRRRSCRAISSRTL